MERCPNCGTPGRLGAKFCTSCGFRFPDDESNPEVGDDTPGLPVNGGEGDPDVVNAEVVTGWPSPPAPESAFSGDWDPPAAPSMSDPPASDAERSETEAISSSWRDETVDPWPAAPDAVAAIAVPDEPVMIEDPDPELEPESAVDLNAHAMNSADSVEAKARANRLLDELRETIAAMEPSATIDLSGVISDLEVAVTPPGAMAAADVAELREALLAARERPRDVDTIVDLTKRVDALLALVIAYDRTIAAIERSLDALRG